VAGAFDAAANWASKPGLVDRPRNRYSRLKSLATLADTLIVRDGHEALP